MQYFNNLKLCGDAALAVKMKGSDRYEFNNRNLYHFGCLHSRYGRHRYLHLKTNKINN